uniref:Uncharacterized protein n=1 Tax=Globodera rostochiensis TaxID=31243 RepID=A0A914HMI1_GLORO
MLFLSSNTRRISSSPQALLHLLISSSLTFPSRFFHPKKAPPTPPLGDSVLHDQFCYDGPIMCHQPMEDNPSGALPVDNWAFVSGVNGQLNGFGGGSFCTDFEPNCASFRRFCFLQSIAEACLWSCGICGGFGGIAGGFGQFGKKRR